jgi:hypothetical protein
VGNKTLCMLWSNVANLVEMIENAVQLNYMKDACSS